MCRRLMSTDLLSQWGSDLLQSSLALLLHARVVAVGVDGNQLRFGWLHGHVRLVDPAHAPSNWVLFLSGLQGAVPILHRKDLIQNTAMYMQKTLQYQYISEILRCRWHSERTHPQDTVKSVPSMSLILRLQAAGERICHHFYQRNCCI